VHRVCLYQGPAVAGRAPLFPPPPSRFTSRQYEESSSDDDSDDDDTQLRCPPGSLQQVGSSNRVSSLAKQFQASSIGWLTGTGTTGPGAVAVVRLYSGGEYGLVAILFCVLSCVVFVFFPAQTFLPVPVKVGMKTVHPFRQRCSKRCTTRVQMKCGRHKTCTQRFW